MSETAEYQRPEGLLMETAAKAKRMSYRALAEKVGMSEARVRNIVNGYQAVGRGQRISVHGPEDTVAKLAAALDITPEQLEAAERPDAAHALRRRLPDGPMPAWAEGDNSEVWRYVVATSEEIREWADDPYLYQPPDAILELFSTDSLLAELGARIATGERDLGTAYWFGREQVALDDDGPEVGTVEEVID